MDENLIEIERYYVPIRGKSAPTSKDKDCHIWIIGDAWKPEAIYCNASKDREKPQWVCYTKDY